MYVDIAPVRSDLFSPIIGDVVQNLRASLDHLVFGLGRSHSGPLTKDQTKALTFPLVVTADQFAKARERRLSPIRNDACAIIEQLQPYNCASPHGYELSYLWHLNKLAIADKHHAIPVVAAIIDRWEVHEIGDGPDVDRSGFAFPIGATLEGRTPVARIPVLPASRDGEVKVKIQGGLTIALQEPPSPLVAKVSVVDLLEEVAVFIEGTVFPCLEPLF